MKQKIQLFLSYLLLVFTCILLGGCAEDLGYDYTIITDEAHGSLTNNQVVATGDVINVTHKSATILLSANYNYKKLLGIKPGIQLSYEDRNSFEDFCFDNIEIEDFNNSELEINVRLRHGYTLYYRAYAVDTDGSKHYGDIKPVTTKLLVSTGDAVDVTHNSAIIQYFLYDNVENPSFVTVCTINSVKVVKYQHISSK